MYTLTEEVGTRSAAEVSARSPDAESLEDLYGRCRPGLVRLGHLLTGSATVAEDVVHDAFVGLARNRRKVRDPAAYLRRSVVNLSVNVHRRAYRERRRRRQARCRRARRLQRSLTWTASGVRFQLSGPLDDGPAPLVTLAESLVHVSADDPRIKPPANCEVPAGEVCPG